MANKKQKLWDVIHEYVRACGGDPSSMGYGNEARKQAIVAVETVVFPEVSPALFEAVNQIESYIKNQAQQRRINSPEAISGAEGNMLFKLSLIREALEGKNDK